MKPSQKSAAQTRTAASLSVFALTLLVAAVLPAQTLPPLHVSAEGSILDNSGKPVLLRGLNRSATGSGNADATATDQDYAAQNQLLSMNLVRIFVNAAWWTGPNVRVPIANLAYPDYIDLLIQRAKKYGNYVVILKAGQFPDAPCGADGKNCSAPNQGDLNCQANPSVCSAQDTTGNNIDTAFAFWAAFAKKYASDPAILYDTWEDMHGILPNDWIDKQNQLITTIRTYNPQALIFVEDAGTAFESITSGAASDLAWSNIVWNFHVFNGSAGTCSEPRSPRYANWPQNFDPLVSYAQQHGHAVAITEWGGCNDSEPYHTNITSYAKTHSIALAYFDSSNLIAQSGGSYQLTATGTKVAQAYSAIAAGGSAGAPVISLVANAFGDTPLIAPNTWVEIKGTNLSPSGDTRIWQGSDFFASQMPPQLDGVSATVNGKTAYVYYISPTQVNILTPPDPIQGPVQVSLINSGVTSNAASVPSQPQSLSFFEFVSSVNGLPYVYGRHVSDNSIIGPTNLFPGLTTPVKPGEPIYVAGTGFGPTTVPIVSGALSQSGTLPTPWPAVKVGGIPVIVTFAGLVGVGTYQFNFVIPLNAPDGDLPLTATYNGLSIQPGLLITVQH